MSEEISIHVKVLSGASHSLRVPLDALVASVQARLADVAGMPVPRQRLIFRGRVLLVRQKKIGKFKGFFFFFFFFFFFIFFFSKAHQTLASYGVSDGAVLHLVTRADPATSSSSSSSTTPPSTTSSESTPPISVRVFNLGELSNGVSLANSVMSALGLNTSTSTTTTTTTTPLSTPPATATALLDLLDDNDAVDDVLTADQSALDHVGRATCERAAANLERLAAQLRRGELCQVRLQRNGDLLRRLAADVQQAVPQAADGAPPQRAPAGTQPSGSLQEVLSATVARLGAADFNLQSLSQSLGPLLNQLSTAAAPIIASATSVAQTAAASAMPAAPAQPRAPTTHVVASSTPASSSTATSTTTDEHLDTLRELLKTVFGTLGVTSLLQIQSGDWAPMQAAHPNLRAALLEQLDVANASDVTPAMVCAFARDCAAAVRHVAMRSDDVPPELAARFKPGTDTFGAVERETQAHVEMFVHLLLKDWTPTESQATPFGDATARWSHMFLSALVAAVRPTVRGGNEDIAAVLRHVCAKTLMASIPAPTATLLTNIVMSHVSRAHLQIQPQSVPIAAPVAAATSTSVRTRPISTAGLEAYPEEWRETIARDISTPVPAQGALSELYTRGQSQKQRSFDARLAAALSAAGVEGVRAQRILGDVPQALKDEFN
jgi:hypothetical protein